ncbi:MAG TPA: phosphodiester glycosidase family protein [Rectinemataceae bacterium]|nr:phosphodiester glycosidase family protein [Rectinemataceae bacterium]
MGRVRRSLARLSALAGVLVASCASMPPAHAAGTPIEDALWSAVSPGIDYASFAWGSPRCEVHALRIDLTRVDVVATPPGKAWGQVDGRSLLDFSRDFNCDAAVNATPFYPETWKRGETLYLSGVLLVDGQLYAAPARRYVALAFATDGRASVVQQGELGDGGNWHIVVGGFFALLRDGEIIARKSPRQPMTVAGVEAGGQGLILAVIEGRRPASAGVSEAEAAQLLLDLGSVDGMSFDGGGSSSMAIGGEGKELRLVNPPAPGFPPIERVLATCLGFRAKAP